MLRIGKDWRQQVAFILILILIPLLIYYLLDFYSKQSSLGIMGPVTQNENDESVYHQIGEFSFIGQNGDEISSIDLQNTIYVANFFFVACPSICPQMTDQIYRVQEEYKDEARVKFISHTVDPVRDSVPILQGYARQYKVDPDKWHLVTGKKEDIYLMARNAYLVTALEGDGGPLDFIHSELLTLVDWNKNIRGQYDGTDPDHVDVLIKDIKKLLKQMPDF